MRCHPPGCSIHSKPILHSAMSRIDRKCTARNERVEMEFLLWWAKWCPPNMSMSCKYVMVKGTSQMWLKISKWEEGILGYPGWPLKSQRCLEEGGSMRRRSCDDWGRTQQCKEGATSQGMQAASGNWKRQGNGFSPRTLQEEQNCGHLDSRLLTSITVRE